MTCRATSIIKGGEMLWLVVMVMVWSLGGTEDLPPPTTTYKVLLLAPMASRSHMSFFNCLAEALVNRGHQVVMVESTPSSLHHLNITHIDSGLTDVASGNLTMFGVRKNPVSYFNALIQKVVPLTRAFHQVPAVRELYRTRREYNVAIVDFFYNQMVYPLVYEIPFVLVSTAGVDHQESAQMGNVLNPAYVPSLFRAYPQPMSLLHRSLNLAWHLTRAFGRQYIVLPKIQEIVSESYPDLPLLEEIERNHSLFFSNSHFSLDASLPLLPSQVEVAGIHCRSAQPLPEDLSAWVSGAGKAGVVYFSLGSIARGDSMPTHYRDLFVEAFRRLDQRVLWKYEEHIPGLSENVLIRKWMPQQDILGDPNVKVFITHCGRMSTLEAIHHATPLLALPIATDQFNNALMIETRGLGLSLVWEELTADAIVTTIQELVGNTKYQSGINSVSSVWKDQPQRALERAVYWVEYLARHAGAPFLRSPAYHLSWVEYFLLDVWFLLLMAATVMCLLLRCLLRVGLRRCRYSTPTKAKGD